MKEWPRNDAGRTSCTVEPFAEFPPDDEGRCSCEQCQLCFAIGKAMGERHRASLDRLVERYLAKHSLDDVE